ncbi:MAG TPA: response regulator transcription factor [Planococcus sp. (in: firmicutes)]|nr:response regulator transcription factor [Planococcus sp. (in: firmicutes)]
MHKVLLVDDEQRMLDLISLYLRPHQYVTSEALGAQQALDMMKDESFDLVLMDIMMPGMDGWELCREIRQFSDVPIIMLTARAQQEDVVKGLRMGADDYISKPFNEQELLARMEALLRRSAPSKSIEIDGLVWDEEQFAFSYLGQPIKLTPKEFSMIGHLMKNPDKVFERARLLDLVWGFESETEGRTVDSHVRNIREKIRQAGFPVDDHFKTVWGIGYKWTKKRSHS